MAATLENISQLERRINITLPAQDIDSEVQTRLKRLARDVKMHGFRPGKVPLKVVAQQYENQVRNEVLGDALQKTFGDTVREQNLKVAGYPRFEPKDTADAAAEVGLSYKDLIARIVESSLKSSQQYSPRHASQLRIA